jgi:hypothetical protein
MASGPRLRWISSTATQATWSLVVDDRARAGALLIDGRPRDEDCDRVRSQIRCELRGVWPGGHTFELRIAGAVMRRTVLIGKPWPERLALVRVATPEEVEAAAKAGADGILITGGETRSLVNAAHAAGTRAFVWSDATAVEWAGADGIIAGKIPPDIQTRFTEAKGLGTPPPEVTDAGAAALALLSGDAIVPTSAFDFLRERRHHRALQHGQAKPASDDAPPKHRAMTVDDRGKDAMTVYVNLDTAPWEVHAYAPPIAPSGVRTERQSSEVHEGSSGITTY